SRTTERRYHVIEVIGLLVPPHAQRASGGRGERVHAPGVGRPGLADDERLVAQRMVMQRPRDRHEVARAAQQQRLAVRGGDADREQRLVDLLAALLAPADDALD